MDIKTDRLQIRDWRPSQDLLAAFAIYGDSQVTRWIGDRTTEATVEAVQARLERFVKKAHAGLGCWAVVNAQTQQPMGSVLLVPLPAADGTPSKKVEIGWHFAPAYWGQGYATEAAQAILRYGFEALGLPEIYAVTLPDNQASIRVTQRLKMTPLGITTDYYGGVELSLFVISNKSLDRG